MGDGVVDGDGGFDGGDGEDVDVDGVDGGDGTWTSGQEGSSMTSPAFAASAPGFDDHQHN